MWLSEWIVQIQRWYTHEWSSHLSTNLSQHQVGLTSLTQLMMSPLGSVITKLQPTKEARGWWK